MKRLKFEEIKMRKPDCVNYLRGGMLPGINYVTKEQYYDCDKQFTCKNYCLDCRETIIKEKEELNGK